MAADVLTVEYAHMCGPGSGCERRGEHVWVRPTCTDGIALVVRPHCIASGAQLVEVSRSIS